MGKGSDDRTCPLCGQLIVYRGLNLVVCIGDPDCPNYKEPPEFTIEPPDLFDDEETTPTIATMPGWFNWSSTDPRSKP